MSLEIPTYNSLLAVTKNLNSLASDLQTQIDLLNQGPPKLNAVLDGLTKEQGFWFDPTSAGTMFSDLAATTLAGTSSNVRRMWDRNGNYSAIYSTSTSNVTNSRDATLGVNFLLGSTSQVGPLYIQNAYMTGVTDEFTFFIRGKFKRWDGMYGIAGVQASATNVTTDPLSRARFSLYMRYVNSIPHLAVGAFGNGDVGILAPVDKGVSIYSVVIRAKMNGVVTLTLQVGTGTPIEYVGFAGSENLFPKSGVSNFLLGSHTGTWPWPASSHGYSDIYQTAFLNRYVSDQERDILLNGTSDPLVSFTPPA